MKLTIYFICAVLLLAAGYIGGTMQNATIAVYVIPKRSKTKPPCPQGYTKIEYGKAVDCAGDTIAIIEHSDGYKEYLMYSENN